eukprot:1316494-Pyramimonas_sp.AAC.1
MVLRHRHHVVCTMPDAIYRYDCMYIRIHARSKAGAAADRGARFPPDVPCSIRCGSSSKGQRAGLARNGLSS